MKSEGQKKPSTINNLLERVLAFIESNRVRKGEMGYYYSRSCTQPTLYSSCYAVLTRDLFGDLENLTACERDNSVAFFNRFQEEDGLFRDPVIYDQGWYKGDPVWCGRLHLSCHVISAITSLGGTAAKPITFLTPFLDPDYLVNWLQNRQWIQDVATVGNEVMNIGTLLQYVRDFQGQTKAGRAVAVLLEWLSNNHISVETGLWGDIDVTNKIALSNNVQAAYHWWPLFFYDHIPVPHVERAIDSVLLTQNPNNGFGWGVHNGDEPFHSSACEDIDSIDPLARMMQLTEYRREDIRRTLKKAAAWVMKNQQTDGGFVFMLGKPFQYGHPELQGAEDQGAMFPTWFRTLSLALIGRALAGHELGRMEWRFNSCPGMQFWT
jgi:hypothetical protein